MVKIKNVFIIIFVIGIASYIFLDDIRNIGDWLTERSYNSSVKKEAKKQAEFMNYGLDKLSDEMIASKAEAENWDFSFQDGLHLIQTDDPDFPYVTSIQYVFTDPKNKNLRHSLRDTFIFDDQHNDWVPLTSSLEEYSSGTFKPIRTFTVWQGDYQIPYFKKD